MRNTKWLVVGIFQTRARMMAVVGGAKVKIGHVRVDLSGGYVAVSQQRLDRTRVGASLQQVSRETMAQGVRRDAFDTRALGVTLYHRPCEMTRERFSAM